MGSTSLDDLTPDTRVAAERFLAIAAENGLDLKVVSTLRSCDEQNTIYAQGRTTPGPIVSGARGCRSWHVFGRALDVLIRNADGTLQLNADPRYEVLGAMAEDLGFVWGGRFGDSGHFEYHPGISIGELCPDPDDCDMAVARYGSHGNYYIPGDVAESNVADASNSSFGKLVFSALVGAVVFQLVAYTATKVREK